MQFVLFHIMFGGSCIVDSNADSGCYLGIDIYFENVGGEQLDAALVALNNFGRIGG